MNNSALANRPLPSIKESFVSMDNKKGNPIASEDINKSDLLDTNTKYNEKEQPIVPVSIKQSQINNDFMVLEGNIYDKMEEYVKNDKKGVITKPKEKNSGNQMNYITQFYVGSLTVIGLFVFYRLIQKTR